VTDTAPHGDARTARARDLLGVRGIPGDVCAEGLQGEIAALRVPADSWKRTADAVRDGLVDEVKRLGFRYVALDLEPGG